MEDYLASRPEFFVGPQHERCAAFRARLKEAEQKYQDEWQAILERAAADGHEGFIALTPGSIPRKPITLAKLDGRVAFGDYNKPHIAKTLLIPDGDKRLAPLLTCLTRVSLARMDRDSACRPRLPRSWKGQSIGDVESLENLRNYARYTLSGADDRFRKLFPLNDVLLNIDGALVEWGVHDCPPVSSTPKDDDDARRELLRKLQWLNAAVDRLTSQSDSKLRSTNGKPEVSASVIKDASQVKRNKGGRHPDQKQIDGILSLVKEMPDATSTAIAAAYKARFPKRKPVSADRVRTIWGRPSDVANAEEQKV